MAAFFFFQTIRSLRPAIIIPPQYGTNLHATYNVTDLPFYCDKEAKDSVLWLNTKLMIPPLTNCLFKLLKLSYDNATDSYVDRENVTIAIHDFGKDTSIQYSDTGITSMFHFIESCATMLNKLKKSGYKLLQNLYAAPYDWRKGTYQTDYWEKLKNLTEQAYSKNDNQRVVIAGASLGSLLLNTFLVDHVSQEWKDKYIDHVVYVAPTFGGTALGLSSLWKQELWGFTIFKSDDLKELIESMPLIYQSLPNYGIFGDDTIIKNEYDREFNASAIPKILAESGKLGETGMKTMKKATNITQHAPRDPNVPVVLIYNSAISTDFSYNFKKGLTEEPIIIQKPGDGTAFAKGSEWVCSHWKSPMTCIDVYRDSAEYSHTAMINNPYVINLAMTETAGYGKKLIRAPYAEIGNSTFRVREDIRKTKVLHY